MGGKIQALPPLKRFMLMQQQENKDNNNGVDNPSPINNSSVSSSKLPAKKRKLSPENSPFFTNNSAFSTSTICLPAKKRIWAFHPFDLNVEYNPVSCDGGEGLVQVGIVQEAEKQGLGTNVTVLEDTHVVEDEEIDEDEDEDEDGIVCAVCGSTDGEPSDPIVLCDGCDLMVHTSCYGHPFTHGVPEGDWFCAQCLESSKSSKTETLKPVKCCLCPEIGGALKPTIDSRWAHVVCALFVPEVFFNDPDGREGIDLSKVPRRRYERKCYICKSRNGCAIDCSEPKCPLSFHVTCGLKCDLSIEYTQGRNKGAIVAGFCRSHTELWKKQQKTGKFKIVTRDEHD